MIECLPCVYDTVVIGFTDYEYYRVNYNGSNSKYTVISMTLCLVY